MDASDASPATAIAGPGSQSMKLSRAAAYALQASVMLAEVDGQGPVPCSSLASQGEMPARFLLQILRSLVNHGVLESTRGVDGGYRLARPADRISLLEIIEAIDGKLAADVPLSASWSGVARSRLESVLQQVAADANSRLDSVKLASLLA